MGQKYVNIIPFNLFLINNGNEGRIFDLVPIQAASWIGGITGHLPKIYERTYYPLEVKIKDITVEVECLKFELVVKRYCKEVGEIMNRPWGYIRTTERGKHDFQGTRTLLFTQNAEEHSRPRQKKASPWKFLLRA